MMFAQICYLRYKKFIKTTLLLYQYSIMGLPMPCGSVSDVIMVVKTAIVGAKLVGETTIFLGFLRDGRRTEFTNSYLESRNLSK